MNTAIYKISTITLIFAFIWWIGMTGWFSSPFLYLILILFLVLMIFLSNWLQQIYLEAMEKEKKIIILEHKGKNFQNTVEEMLDNKIIKFFAEVRQPISDIRQMAYYLESLDSQEAIEQERKRIIAASEEALQMIKLFEEQSTGKKLLTNPS